MSENEKYYCNRCNKEINSSFIYISEIDHKYLCYNCFKKEQPKELIKIISELKKQFEELKEKYEWEKEQHNVSKLELADTERDYEKLKQELAELKEKAIVPKFKVGQKVYGVFINRKYMECNEVCNLEITAIMKCNNGIFYQGYVLKKGKNRSDYWFNEENTFLTEQEAIEKLKEIQGNG